MNAELSALVEQLALFAVSGLAGAYLATRHWKSKLRSEAPAKGVPQREQEIRSANERFFERARVAEESARALERSILQIPETAQRLFSAGTLRQVPDIALDLVEDLFAPSFALFYRLHHSGFVAAARRGECEFELGHRLAKGEGVVGWTAVRQLPFTSEDAAHESRGVRERALALAMPRAGFTVCLPIVSGEETIGVILVGPSPRKLADPKGFGRTIALLTAVAISNIELLQQKQHLAATDGLTGLLNKRAILEYLNVRLAADRARPLSIFLFDIDHFKKYNDTNGHLAGDDLLKGMGALLREHSRDGEGLGRYGGEEFVLVMEGAPKSHGLAAAERLRELVEHAHFPHREHQPGGKLTISGGVATWPTDASDPTSLLRAADQALYEGKRAGRNRVVAYHAPDLAALDEEEDSEVEKREPAR